MKSRRLVLVALPAILLIGSLIRVRSNKTPDMEMMEAGKMLKEAQIERSPGFAKEIFHEASSYYDSAMIEWKNQNEKFIVFRNFNKTKGFANKSISCSEEAIQTARKAILNTEDQLELSLRKTGDKIKSFEESFSNFPMDKKHRDAFTRSKMLYSESLQAYKNKNYSGCKIKLDSVETSINRISDHYQGKLEEYFEAYPQWNAILVHSISYSKKNHVHVLLVDKIARELIVYKNGEIVKQYPVELGANWVGDKMQQGDKSTPEGVYKILEKKQNGQTRYHKAFLLDYPNDEDKHRFSLNKKNGLLTNDARIGNLIEIHGSGGKGTDWTDGCIALRDSDMDELYALCPVGTRVTIVGSSKSLNNLSYNQQ